MLNLRQFADYLLYRLRANTRHGTHSPFVYRLVDKVIYDYSAKKVYTEVENNSPGYKTKIGRLLYRLAADWQPINIVVLGSNSNYNANYLQSLDNVDCYVARDVEQYQAITRHLNQFDFVFIKGGEPIAKWFEVCMPKISDRTVLAIADIYHDNETKTAWDKIKADGRVIITIDMFAIGLVYFRKGQVKEDFTIRF